VYLNMREFPVFHRDESAIGKVYVFDFPIRLSADRIGDGTEVSPQSYHSIGVSESRSDACV
jgi:hypothetical protein